MVEFDIEMVTKQQQQTVKCYETDSYETYNSPQFNNKQCSKCKLITINIYYTYF